MPACLLDVDVYVCTRGGAWLADVYTCECVVPCWRGERAYVMVAAEDIGKRM